MKKTMVVPVILAGLLAGGCSSIVKKPDIYTVKKLAIISVYANNSIYNSKTMKSDSGLNLAALKHLVGKEDEIETDEITQIVTGGFDAYLNSLKKLKQWVIVDPKTVFNHPSYKTLGGAGWIERLSYAQYTPAYNSKVIHFLTVAKTGSMSYVNGKEVHEEARKELAQFCKALNVDGVAIIELDLAYKPGFLSSMGGTGVFKSVKAPASPDVSAAMIIITKNGAIAAQTDGIAKGGGNRFVGEKVSMLHQGKVALKSKDGENVKEYVRVIALSAEDLRGRIEKELAN